MTRGSAYLRSTGHPCQGTHLPLVRWRDPISLQRQTSDPLLTHGRGYVCPFPRSATAQIWVPVRNVCPVNREFRAQGGIKRVSDILELESQIIVNYLP